MLAEIGAQFQLEGTYAGCERYHGGHINDTYFATYALAGGQRRYVHQRINAAVFRDPPALTRNIAAVTRHVREKLVALATPDIERRVLRLLPTAAGDDLLITAHGEYWRTYPYIESTVCYGTARGPQDAYSAARAFGEFARLLSDFPVESLHVTLPNFHDTPLRFNALVQAIDADAHNRAALANGEIAQALRLQPLCSALQEVAAAADLPLRPTHNDTKITNVLFDERTGEAMCILDLDTIMPGLTLYDVGELVRTAATRAAEDEPDPSKVEVDTDLFESVANGFIAGAGAMLTAAERNAFVTAGKVLAYENGIRFLADYLNGDVYFRVHRDCQNLDRARAQFAVAQSLERQEEDLLRRMSASEPAA
ncbi:MAG TPA: aminoglycoside phosphotransferase family protein [Candidatus Baltobacteraceae bacterium]